MGSNQYNGKLLRNLLGTMTPITLVVVVSQQMESSQYADHWSNVQVCIQIRSDRTVI